MTRRRAIARLVPLAVSIAMLSAGLGMTIALDPCPLLVWNSSESAPPGLYAVRPHAQVLRGDLVLAWAPDAARALAARRHYLPGNVPLLKRVAAIAGDRICARGNAITVNGEVVAARRIADRQHRPLPAWQGCRTLRARSYLLLMPHPDSFDGRYFGPSDAGSILGRAVPLWVG